MYPFLSFSTITSFSFFIFSWGLIWWVLRLWKYKMSTEIVRRQKKKTKFVGNTNSEHSLRALVDASSSSWFFIGEGGYGDISFCNYWRSYVTIQDQSTLHPTPSLSYSYHNHSHISHNIPINLLSHAVI